MAISICLSQDGAERAVGREIVNKVKTGEEGSYDYGYLSGRISWNRLIGGGEPPVPSSVKFNKLIVQEDACVTGYVSGDVFARFSLRLVPELPDQNRLKGISFDDLVMKLGVPTYSEEHYFEWGFATYVTPEEFNAKIISLQLDDDGAVETIWVGDAKLGRKL